jgi:hypothetical protein
MLGLVASGLFASLLWATETIPSRRFATAGLGIALGGAIFWSPILLYYWHHGHLVEYIQNIFMVGSQVLAGLSNIPTSGSIWSFPERRVLFYGFTPFVMLVGCSTLYKNLELRRPLNWNQVLLLSFLCVSITNFLGSLTRTDITHLLNVSIGLPLLLAYSIKVVPSFVPEKKSLRVSVVAALTIFTFFISFYQYDTGWLISRIRNPLKKYGDFEQAMEVPPHLAGKSFAKTGYDVLPREAALEPAISIRDDQTFKEMDDYFVLFEEIGSRLEGKTVYVHSIPGAAPGLAYFFADLTPAPIFLDPYTMVFSSDVQTRFLEHYETIVGEIHCVVSEARDISTPELELFLRANPEAEIEQMSFRGIPIHIVCR